MYLTLSSCIRNSWKVFCCCCQGHFPLIALQVKEESASCKWGIKARKRSLPSEVSAGFGKQHQACDGSTQTSPSAGRSLIEAWAGRAQILSARIPIWRLWYLWPLNNSLTVFLMEAAKLGKAVVLDKYILLAVPFFQLELIGFLPWSLA